MKSIVELSQVSNYRPQGGYALELYEIINLGTDRSDALVFWEKNGRSPDSFRQALKKLKDNLLKEAFDKNIELSDTQKRRIYCWERFYKTKAMLVAGKNDAAASIGGETIPLAQKCGLTEVVLSISIFLESHYATIAPSTQKYLRYRKLRKTSSEDFNWETKADTLYSSLIFHYLKKKDIGGLTNEILEIQNSKCKSNRFIQLKCTVLTTWHELRGAYNALEDTLRETLRFFDKNSDNVAFTTHANLYRRLADILIPQKRFDEGEHYLSNAIKLPDSGSYLFHQLLLHKAILGLHSDKPHMALDAYQRAKNNRNHTNERTDQLWELIRAYLAVYEELGRIKLEKPFRMRKLENSLSEIGEEKQGANVAVKIAVFLVHLLRGDKKAYSKKSDGVSAYCHKHLRGEQNIRARSILYMLRKVEEADYYKLRTELRIGRWKKYLRDNPLHVVNYAEMMPYGKVWEIVLSRLK